MPCHDGAHHGLVQLAVVFCLQPALLLYPLAGCSPFCPLAIPPAFVLLQGGSLSSISLMMAAGRGEESNFWPGMVLSSLPLGKPMELVHVW